MAAYTTVEDWKHVEAGYVIAVTIRTTEDDQYPSGWDYSLHLGRVGGETVLRYDNAHERTKGHERHTDDGVEHVEFRGCSTSTIGFDVRSRSEPRSPGSELRRPPPGTTHVNAKSHRR